MNKAFIDDLSIRIFDSSPLAFCILKIIVDEAGTTPLDWEFAYCNDALAEVDGIDKETLLTHSWF